MRTFCFLTFVAAPLVVSAGPIEDFVAARFKHQIGGLSSGQSLKDVKEEIYLELQAKVGGSIRSESGVTIIVRFGDVSHMVDAKTPPVWLQMSVTDVRLIVKATPVPTQILPALEIVASVPEADVPMVDEKFKFEEAKRAEDARKATEDARLKVMSEGESTGIEGLLTSPPAGSTFRGAIGRAKPTTTKELQALVPEYMAVIQSNNKNLHVKQAELIAECVLAYSSVFGVDARLVMSVIKHESNFNPQVTSHAGAQGLGQLMPDTARSLGISDPYDIVQNVYGTVRTLRGHLERQGKVARNNYEMLVRALAAYNAGPGAVAKYGGLPPYAETEKYVERVIRTYFQLSGHKG